MEEEVGKEKKERKDKPRAAGWRAGEGEGRAM